MASPGTEHEHEEPGSSAADASTRDGGNVVKPAVPRPETNRGSPAAGGTKAGAERAASEVKAVPSVETKASPPLETQPSPNETSPLPPPPSVESPPVDPPPPVEVPPVQAPPPIDAPLLTAPLQGPAAAETPLLTEAGTPPATEPMTTGASAEATGAASAPFTAASSSPESSTEIASGPSRLVALFGPRPRAAWLAVAGAAGVLLFLAGVLTGRGLGNSPERRVTPVPSPKAAAPSSAAAPILVAPTGGSAQVPVARQPRMPATQTKPGSAGFNAQAAKLAIDRIVPRLKACKQAGEPPGSATVTVTFAPTGRVSSAQVTNTRYAGTRTGNCIVQRLREARVPEFSGAPVTVKRSLAVR